MCRKLFLIVFGISISCLAFGQFNPPNNDTINYTQVLIEFPWIPKAAKYKVEMWNQNNVAKKSVYETEANAIVINDLNFNNGYSWKVWGLDSKGKMIGSPEENVFFICSSKFSDSSFYRYRNLKNNSSKIKNGIIFFDGGRVAVTREGKPIWFLPKYRFETSRTILRALKITPEGTIIFIADTSAAEVDLSGKILWRAPNDGKVSGRNGEMYHHDFKKLKNGNYMILGNILTKTKIPELKDSAVLDFGTIIEYSKQGNVVWSWYSKDYFPDNYRRFKKKNDGTFDTGMHLNAFSTDGEFVYAGFRDGNTILKIQKSNKQVVSSFGSYGISDTNHYANGFFRKQHDANILSNGDIAVLNNDSIIDPSIVSSVVVFSQPTPLNPKSQKVFEFRFDFDALTNGKSLRYGNVVEMPNENLLVNMGGINRSFEVNRNKEILWDMFTEELDTVTLKWKPFPNYQISFSSSLYPYYFTSKIVSNVVVKENRVIELKVWNIGSENDSYTFSVEQNGKILIKDIQMQSIKPQKSQTIKILLPLSSLDLQAKYKLNVFSVGSNKRIEILIE